MKFSTVLAFLAVSVSAVAASPYGGNAHRLARGLPPLPPQKRSTSVAGAKRGQPSSTPSPSQCNTGPIQCCNSVSSSSDPKTSTLLGLLNLDVPIDVPIGLGCSPINVVGSNPTCSTESVCCENNNFNGLINIGCTPINIFL